MTKRMILHKYALSTIVCLFSWGAGVHSLTDSPRELNVSRATIICKIIIRLRLDLLHTLNCTFTIDKTIMIDKLRRLHLIDISIVDVSDGKEDPHEAHKVPV